ncbi:acetate/propionate family kinase [Demequina gelatinilytica]|uniref:acetate/propionate family kinase n=1 Tax=Demequina gelatinilytica TaxID=1638980 RepID=UPI0007832F45|nr:acetate kinase [Demequina gelatinilytica]
MSVNYNGIALVLNCGSSSIKYQVVDTTQEEALASGLVERVTDHNEGVRAVIESLSEPGSGVDLSQLTVVGHRVVQGGAEFSAPTIIDDEVEEAIAKLSVLAPLHNPGHVAGISAARAAFPDIPHVAVFDTAFHQTLSEAAYSYAIDPHIAAEHGIRRYGFHGTSHGHVSAKCAELMDRDPKELRIITLHLGNGASADAVKGGVAIDTSMGLTPLDGLVMGSRTGAIDPAVVFHLHRAAGLDIDEIDDLFNKRSGMLGLTGHSDMRDVHTMIEEGSHEARVALDIYTRRIKGYVGQYMAQLGGLDAIVFTAGVGENDDIVRIESLTGLEELGIEIDAERNAGRKKQATLISTDTSRVQVWVIPTNEERAIALQSVASVS